MKEEKNAHVVEDFKPRGQWMIERFDNATGGI